MRSGKGRNTAPIFEPGEADRESVTKSSAEELHSLFAVTLETTLESRDVISARIIRAGFILEHVTLRQGREVIWMCG